MLILTLAKTYKIQLPAQKNQKEAGKIGPARRQKEDDKSQMVYVHFTIESQTEPVRNYKLQN
ncbi:hypothetical protein OC25_02040 [Pedobacter kyungheensis]|uniref:Uncharacterized protein n=1 Tax=Pedobacter kyungheensis TaxID=1069985 RepID=A0A0C1G8W6_9SPHI|nr:hypothetical protein OC25_02040 [Pedobacter kyungheensis]